MTAGKPVSGSQHNGSATSAPAIRKTASDNADPDAEVEATIMGDVSEELFFDLADSFIELANQHSDRMPIESISAALMFAASRYNAFLAVSEAPVDRLEPATAADYYSLQYRKMFEDNLDEYAGRERVVDDDSTAVD